MERFEESHLYDFVKTQVKKLDCEGQLTFHY